MCSYSKSVTEKRLLEGNRNQGFSGTIVKEGICNDSLFRQAFTLRRPLSGLPGTPGYRMGQNWGPALKALTLACPWDMNKRQVHKESERRSRTKSNLFFFMSWNSKYFWVILSCVSDDAKKLAFLQQNISSVQSRGSFVNKCSKIVNNVIPAIQQFNW